MKRRTLTEAEMRPTEAQLDHLRRLDGPPETDDLPPAPLENWKNARRFFKVRKEPISIRLDADLLDWLRNRGPGYQVEINRFLRERMEAEVAKAG